MQESIQHCTLHVPVLKGMSRACVLAALRVTCSEREVERFVRVLVSLCTSHTSVVQLLEVVGLPWVRSWQCPVCFRFRVLS